MVRSISGHLLAAALAIAASGCGPQGEVRKETYPVTGIVMVDGAPAAEVQVVLTDVKGIDKNSPTLSQTFTDKEGKFAVSTYEQGDGVPEGEYVVSFAWREINAFSMQYSGPDKLKEKYSNPASSTFKIKVEKGKPADMGRIELTTK